MRKITKRAAVSFIVVLMLGLASQMAVSSDRSEEPVFYNVKTHKVHKMSCIWAKKCTVNCIKIKRADAYNRGGIPCKVCGG